MALNWIKVEKATARKPEILKIASDLGIHSDHAFGLCIRFWCWCDDQMESGYAQSVTPVALDSVFSCDGLTHALIKVGWLTTENDMLVIPNWDRHLSKSAKKRALSAERMVAHRLHKKRNSSDAIVTRPLILSNPLSTSVEREGRNPKTKKVFSIPTVDDVRAYCLEIGSKVDPQAFVNFYESKGWMIGRNKMANWKAAIGTWERNSHGNNQGNHGNASGRGREQERLDRNAESINQFLQSPGVWQDDSGTRRLEADG